MAGTSKKRGFHIKMIKLYIIILIFTLVSLFTISWNWLQNVISDQFMEEFNTMSDRTLENFTAIVSEDIMANRLADVESSSQQLINKSNFVSKISIADNLDNILITITPDTKLAHKTSSSSTSSSSRFKELKKYPVKYLDNEFGYIYFLINKEQKLAQIQKKIDFIIIATFCIMLSFVMIILAIENFFFLRPFRYLNEKIRCLSNFQKPKGKAPFIIIDEINEVDKSLDTLLKIKEKERLLLKKEEDVRISKNASMNMFLLLSRLSHEMRTTLSAILGCTDMIELKNLSETDILLLKNIKNSSDKLLNLITDVHEFSLISTNQLELKANTISLRNCTRRVAEEIAPQLVKKGNQLKVNFASKIKDLVIADEKKFTKILSNLLDNACKFTQNGKIEITATLIEQENDWQKLLISIKDNGIGIEKDKIKDIFNPFRNLEKHTTKDFEGSGLGLSICNSIIAKMHGKISCESDIGLGSTFKCELKLQCSPKQNVINSDTSSYTLPDKNTKNNQEDDLIEDFLNDIPEVSEVSEVSETKPANSSKTPSSTPSNQAKKNGELGKFALQHPNSILIAEDTPMMQKLLKAIFQKLGYSTTIVPDGVEALKKLEQEEFSLIFLDLNMPKLGGFETAETIRKQAGENGKFAKYKETPIVAVSAYLAAREKCVNTYFDDFINKPVKAETIAEAILKQEQKQS